jgi:hypothetical protein
VQGDDSGLQKSVNWRRRVLIATGVLCALVLIFHRPLLLSLGHRIAIHFASRENLKAQFRLEGNPFGSLTFRNVHAFPTGPSDVESIDADLVHVDYGLITLLRHGISSAVKNIEVRSARVVLNPAQVTLRARPPNPEHKISLPDIFPERMHLSDVSVTVRNRPHDFALEHLDLDLDPTRVGELNIGRLQMVGGQTWLRISAQTSYTNRVLVLRDVILANEERIRSVTVDASQIAARKLTINFDYVAGGGNISGVMALREDQSTLDTKVELRGTNLPLGVINKYAALPENFISGEVATLNVSLTGLLSSPKTWSGTVMAQVSNFRQEATAFDHAALQVSAQNGTATLQSADFTQGKNQFHLRGSTELPMRIEDFGRTPTTIEIAAITPDLSEVTAGMPQKVSGSGQINGRIDIHDSKLNGEFSLSAGGVRSADGEIEKISASIKLSKVLSPPEAKKPWFADLQSETTLAMSNVKLREYAADSVEATLHSAEDLVTVDRANVRRKQNDFAVTGQYRLPADLQQATSQPAKLDVSLNAVQLADYWATDSEDRISGPLQINGQVEWKNGTASGQLNIFGAGLKRRDLVIHQVSAQCTIDESVVYLNDVRATLNDRDFLAANGIADLRGAMTYRGKLTTNLTDLAVFNPILQASGNPNRLGGSFVVDWEGNGELKTFKHSGKLKVSFDNGRYGQLQALQARIDASYSPDGFNVPIIFFRSDKMDFQAVAQTQGERLEINKIQLNQGAAKYADGYVSIPFVWKNLGTNASLFPSEGTVSANFQTENLDIKKVFQDVGLTPPASGTLNVKFDAGGTLSRLTANLALQMRDLRSDKIPKLDPANFDLTARAENGQVNITGQLQQPKIQPIALSANFPATMSQVMRQHGLPDNTPVNASIRLPRSSVNFVRQFVPAVEELDGDVGLDVAIKGTIAQPILSGSGDMTVNVGRFSNPTLPALQNFKARIVFNRDTLTFERFGGELAGGPFTLAGRVTFPRLTQANLELQFKANSILVARNDSLTARSDADIRITGPINAASVTGNVALTNSHFLKNLDLIPIGLPGRPAPEPPASRPEFSIPDPPYRNWTFDVAIKTKDPFSIRGSLATGNAIIDLHLTGTGLHPALEGQVRMENVEATLPFSRLDVQYGFLYFDPSDPLNPKLDLHGTSVIRDYTIHVYVYGRSLSPEAVFTSEPPLPQEEIISLLATGTTRQELTGNNNVLAGRAAMLLFQQLYRKVFKKGENTKSNSVFDRLDVDFGQVDPRTGQQTATARLKVNQNFVLVGDIEVGGDFRGLVKYVIRFH